MIEPAIIAVITAVGSGLIFKLTETLAGQQKRKPVGPPGIFMAESFGEGTPEQQFTHKTLMLEKENFPDWHEDLYTKCDCPKCLKEIRREVVKDTWKPRKRTERVLGSYVFQLPPSVPENAHGELVQPLSSSIPYGWFTWTDTKTGQHMSTKITPVLELAPGERHDIYTDQYEKLILHVKPKRVDNMQTDIDRIKRLMASDKRQEKLIAKHREEFIAMNKRLPQTNARKRRAPEIQTEKGYK